MANESVPVPAVAGVPAALGPAPAGATGPAATPGVAGVEPPPHAASTSVVALNATTVPTDRTR